MTHATQKGAKCGKHLAPPKNSRLFREKDQRLRAKGGKDYCMKMAQITQEKEVSL